MKNCFLISILCLCSVLIAEASPQDYKCKKVVFLSYPHTGTNWTMSALQYLTKRKFLGCTHKRNHSIWNRLGVKYDNAKLPIYRTHFWYRVTGLHPKGYKLLFVMRNYREVFFRRAYFKSTKINCFRKRLSHFIKEYLAYFKTFEKWPEDDRHLFTYEQLLKQPRETLEGILASIHEPNTYLDEFMGNIDVLKQKCLESYHKQHKHEGGSLTKGKHFQYHCKQVHPKLVEELDVALKKAAGEELWNKYFAQYCVEL